MAQRWYQSRMVQAASIAAIGAILAAILSQLHLLWQPKEGYVEIRTTSIGGEQTLSKLALRPSGELLDSTSFLALPSRNWVISESLGVAFQPPQGQEWTVGPLGKLQSVGFDDVVFMSFINDLVSRGWPESRTAGIAYFGARLDQPVRVTLERDSRIGSVVLGENPFESLKYSIGFLRMAYGSSLLDLPEDTIIATRQAMKAAMDSVIASKLPVDRLIYSGVFVSRVDRTTLPQNPYFEWAPRTLLDDIGSDTRTGLELPALLLVDRDKHILLLNETVRLDMVRVNGSPPTRLIVNRVGYAIERGSFAYLVVLQYISSDRSAVLSTLEDIFKSVRLRQGAA